MDWYDVLAGGLLGLILAILVPNRLLIWTWKPKTRWGKRRNLRRVNDLSKASEVDRE